MSSSISYSFTALYTYKNYVLGYWDDVEEDNIKRFWEYCRVDGPEAGKPKSVPFGQIGRAHV